MWVILLSSLIFTRQICLEIKRMVDSIIEQLNQSSLSAINNSLPPAQQMIEANDMSSLSLIEGDASHPSIMKQTTILSQSQPMEHSQIASSSQNVYTPLERNQGYSQVDQTVVQPNTSSTILNYYHSITKTYRQVSHRSLEIGKAKKLFELSSSHKDVIKSVEYLINKTKNRNYPSIEMFYNEFCGQLSDSMRNSQGACILMVLDALTANGYACFNINVLGMYTYSQFEIRPRERFTIIKHLCQLLSVSFRSFERSLNVFSSIRCVCEEGMVQHSR